MRFKFIRTGIIKCVVSALFLILISGAQAQDLEPRAYTNIPVGLNFILAGYGYSEGEVATDPTLPLENGELQVHQFVAAYARSLNLWGVSGGMFTTVPGFISATSVSVSTLALPVRARTWCSRGWVWVAVEPPGSILSILHE